MRFFFLPVERDGVRSDVFKHSVCAISSLQGYSVTQGGELVFKQLHFCCLFCLLLLEFLSRTMKNLAVSASSHSERCFSLPPRKVMCGKAARDQTLSFFTLFPFQFSCSRTVL